jgi:hypothetical protein
MKTNNIQSHCHDIIENKEGYAKRRLWSAVVCHSPIAKYRVSQTPPISSCLNRCNGHRTTDN